MCFVGINLMKKKLLALAILPFLLSSCSLFEGIFDSGESYTYTSRNSSEISNSDNSNDPYTSKPSTTSQNARPHIAFDSEGFEYEESTGNYLITMKRGSSITLNAVIANGDSSEYSLIYSWARGGEYGTINNNTVRINDDASLTATPYLQISLQKNGTSTAIDIILIRITIIDKYQISVISKSDDVLVLKSDTYGVDYQLKVPLANIFYELPLVKLEDYNDPYTVEFVNDEGEYYKDKIEFKNEENNTYFQIIDKYNMLSTYRFHALIKDNDNKTLKDLTLGVTETLESEDVLTVYYGDYSEKLTKGQTITIEKEETAPITLVSYFNGNALATYSTAYSVTTDDVSVATISKKLVGETTKYVVNPLGKVGTAKISVSYTFKEVAYTIDFYVSVVDTKTLESVYVPAGADAFRVYNENNVIINGKIYAIYSVGEPEAINGHPNLSVTVSMINRKYAKVTLSYTYRGVTKEASYDVNTDPSPTYAKRLLTKNYETMWANAGYRVMPSTGDAAALVIPIWFTDSPDFINVDKKDENGLTQKEQVLEDINLIVFGDNEQVPWRSLKTYYREESYGKLNIVGKVSDWYEVDHASTRYAYQDTAINTLAASAVKWYFDNNPSETRSDYDKNNDGKIDTLILYYGTNYHVVRENGQPRTANWLRRTNSTGDSSISNYAWMSYATTYNYDGLKASMTGQLEANDLSTVGLFSKTVIHEVGHAFGLSDYYDNTLTREPVGVLNMQSSDSGGHDAFSVMAMGWTEPYVFSAENAATSTQPIIEITIKDFQSTGDLIILTPKWDGYPFDYLYDPSNPNPPDYKEIFDEYLVLELYTPTGLNAKDAARTDVDNAKVPGIRLWHVNAKLGSNGRHLYGNSSNDSNFDLLHLIRNDTNKDYYSLARLSDADLFKQGDSFTMDKFKSQFYNHDGKLDDGRSLGFSFGVTKIETDTYGNATATIRITYVGA